MELSQVKKLQKGEFFKLNDSETSPVWVRDYYDPSDRKYLAYKFDDINHSKWFKSSKSVFVGFTF